MLSETFWVTFNEGYDRMGIRNCRHKGLEECYVTGKTKHIPAAHWKNILYILDHLAAITDIKDCYGVKGFHGLKGDRLGTYAMNVSGNYRLTFKWDGEHVYDVNYEDYH